MEVAAIARRKITIGDWVQGALQSIRNGTAMNPIATQKLINAVHDERMMGTGAVGGDRNWTPPVHGTTLDGRPVTISFGIGPRKGETLVTDGHVGFKEFYAYSKPGKGHDLFLVDGKIASKIDRHRSS